MKKLLVTLLAVIAISVSANAQAIINIGYGGYTQMDACDMSHGVDSKTAWGALTAGVYFQTLPNLQLGASYTFSSSSAKALDDLKFGYHVIMFNAKYDYLTTGIFKVYAHAGVGVDITRASAYGEHENKAYFALQISPACAEAALSNTTSLFGELGFGAQGLLQVGVRFHL